MKTTTLLAAAILMVSTASASANVAISAPRGNVLFSNDNPIEFTERGIRFFVFPNGEFDFSTEASTGSGDYYRGNRLNTTFGAPGHANGGTRIEHDAMGRVRRIGNVFINYDANGRVKRAGTVYMTYNRTLLTQIGGLRLVYDRRGRLIDMVGSVKGRSTIAYNTYYGPSTTTYGYNDDAYYYYRADGTKALIEEKK